MNAHQLEQTGFEIFCEIIDSCLNSFAKEIFIGEFFDALPKKPYCSNELRYGSFIRAKANAIQYRHIQVNHPEWINFITFDVDRAGAVFALEDAGLPRANWTCKTPANAHAHLGFMLALTVCSSSFEHQKPLRYLSAIISAIEEKIEADKNYAHHLTKNPLHPAWQTHIWTDHKYTLEELAANLDLKGHPRKRGIEATGIGRNCELFESAAKWSYREIRQYWSPNYYDRWFEAVLMRCESENSQFLSPLSHSEVKAIAKSIAKWTYKHFTPEGFRRSQASKGAKGGKVSKGGGRPKSFNMDVWLQVQSLKIDGLPNRQIAERLSISASTVSKYLKITSE